MVAGSHRRWRRIQRGFNSPRAIIFSSVRTQIPRRVATSYLSRSWFAEGFLGSAAVEEGGAAEGESARADPRGGDLRIRIVKTSLEGFRRCVGTFVQTLTSVDESATQTRTHSGLALGRVEALMQTRQPQKEVEEWPLARYSHRGASPPLWPVALGDGEKLGRRSADVNPCGRLADVSGVSDAFYQRP